MKLEKVKIRSVYFILGLLIGMAVSMSSNSMHTMRMVRQFVLQKTFTLAGNQPLAGKVAVAQVVLNRMEHASYPKDVCGVVYQAKWRENWKGQQVPIRHQCQFSWFCDGKSDEPLDTDTFYESYIVASDVLMGKYPDITEGATHYHSIMVEPYWSF